MTMRTDITTFDDAIDYVMSMVDADFARALALCDSILESPSSFAGPQGAIAAMKLAIYRTKIGTAAQYWKNKTVGSQNRQDKLVKDALMCMYDGLVEVINTLKLNARHEHDIATTGAKNYGNNS